MNLFDLKGKNAIVVGGSKGLGYGMATGLAKAGANVILTSRNQAELDAAAEKLAGETGRDVVGMSADVTKSEQVDALVQMAAERFGHIDILINSAGFTIRKPVLEQTEEDWDAVQDLQLKSVFLMCRAVAKHMVEKGIRGRIINIGSLTSQIAVRNIVSYCTAKGGIVMLTRSLALELAPYGINCNTIGPGYFETEMTKALFQDEARVAEMFTRIPMKRFGNPYGDLGGVAVFLASAASDYVNGAFIPVDGGWLSA